MCHKHDLPGQFPCQDPTSAQGSQQHSRAYLHRFIPVFAGDSIEPKLGPVTGRRSSPLRGKKWDKKWVKIRAQK